MADNPPASPPCYQHELGADYDSAADWHAIRDWRRSRRTELVAERRRIDARTRMEFDGRIRKLLADFVDVGNTSVAFYWPLPGEPDLRPFIRSHIRSGGDAALAVIVHKNKPLEFWRWDESTVMEGGGVWNIPTPAERMVVVPDVVLVPLLGFDDGGHRLGHGGGYYDRTFASLDSDVVRVGVGYSIGKIDTINPQPHDVPMDAIVTEEGITSWTGVRPSFCP